MEKKVITISNSVKTVVEFEEVLKLLKVQNPIKYAILEKSGEIDRYKKTLVQEPKEERKVEKKVEKKDK